VLDKSAWLKNGQSNRVVGLLSVSTKLNPVDADQEKAVGDVIGGASVGRV
jgi:hypothetical protein